MLTRGFYALQANWAPTLVALGSLVLNVVLDIGLYRVGVWGLPLATALANVVAVGALLVMMGRKTGTESIRATSGSLVRIVVASVVATAVAVAVWWGIDALFGRSIPGQLVSVGGAVLVGTGAYLGACRIMRVRELNALRALRAR